jgi:large subunit ribosomal protein L6
MKQKELKDELKIPEGIQVSFQKGLFEVKGQKGTIQRKLEDPRVKIVVEAGKINFESKMPTKREKKMINTYKAHLKNMFHGVKEAFVYKLKICSGHFPMNVSTAGDEFVVKNFLGEKVPRKMKFDNKNVSIKIDGAEVTVEGNDKEKTGQTAASIEQLTRRPGFDRRIFQDGIYITEKPKREQM